MCALLGSVTLRPGPAGFGLVDVFALALQWIPQLFRMLCQAARCAVPTLILSLHFHLRPPDLEILRRSSCRWQLKLSQVDLGGQRWVGGGG